MNIRTQNHTYQWLHTDAKFFDLVQTYMYDTYKYNISIHPANKCTQPEHATLQTNLVNTGRNCLCIEHTDSDSYDSIVHVFERTCATLVNLIFSMTSNTNIIFSIYCVFQNGSHKFPLKYVPNTCGFAHYTSQSGNLKVEVYRVQAN